MAPPRRAHSPKESVPLYADDTDPELEPDTPRLQKGTLKKRLSEAYVPDGDGSTDSSRPPLRSVNINDDAAEKRRRRKSTKITVVENAQAGSSSEGNHEQEADTSRTSKQKLQLKSVALPMDPVSLDLMNPSRPFSLLPHASLDLELF